MEVRTPYLPHPIDVRGQASYHVEHHGCVHMICDAQGMNRVSFYPGEGVTVLRDDLPENLTLCHAIANFLNEAMPIG